MVNYETGTYFVRLWFGHRHLGNARGKAQDVLEEHGYQLDSDDPILPACPLQ